MAARESERSNSQGDTGGLEVKGQPDRPWGKPCRLASHASPEENEDRARADLAKSHSPGTPCHRGLRRTSHATRVAFEPARGSETKRACSTELLGARCIALAEAHPPLLEPTIATTTTTTTTTVTIITIIVITFMIFMVTGPEGRDGPPSARGKVRHAHMYIRPPPGEREGGSPPPPWARSPRPPA